MNNIIPVLILAIELTSPSGVFSNPVNYASQARNIFIEPLNDLREASANKFVHAVDIKAPITYEEIKIQALNYCKYNKAPDEKLIDMLIDIEKSYGVPSSMRGMLLSAACMESGYNHRAKGDKKFSKDKKTPMAIGLLQLWPFYERMYKINRLDPESSAHAWMKHIVKQVPKVKRQCKYKRDGKVWLAAWVTGIRYKKVGGRCKERPLHYRLLKKWHKNIKKCRTGNYETCPPGC